MKTTSYAYQEEDISEVTVKLEADELPIRGDEEAGREEEAPHAVMSEEVRTVASLPTSSAPPQAQGAVRFGQSKLGLNWQTKPVLNSDLLIREVQKYPDLYDVSFGSYKDNAKKDIIWRCIAKMLQVSEDECKNRWKTLRDTYVKKLKLQPAADSRDGLRKEWKHMSAMAFLCPHISIRSSRVQVEGCEGPTEPAACAMEMDPADDQKSERSSELVATPTPETQPAPATASPWPKPLWEAKRRRSSRPPHHSGDLVDQALLEILRQAPPTHAVQAPPPTLDDVDHFLRSLAPQLRRVAPRHQTRARIRMLTVLEDFLCLQEKGEEWQDSASPSSPRQRPCSPAPPRSHSPPADSCDGPASRAGSLDTWDSDRSLARTGHSPVPSPQDLSH